MDWLMVALSWRILPKTSAPWKSRGVPGGFLGSGYQLMCGMQGTEGAAGMKGNCWVWHVCEMGSSLLWINQPEEEPGGTEGACLVHAEPS